jgi:hypothetical protein
MLLFGGEGGSPDENQSLARAVCCGRAGGGGRGGMMGVLTLVIASGAVMVGWSLWVRFLGRRK